MALGKKRCSVAKRCFWLIIYIISFLFLGYLLHSLIKKSQDRSIVVVENHVPLNIYEIPFPAVTVCLQNKLNRESHDKISQVQFNDSSTKLQYEMAFQICDRTLVQTAIQNYNGFNLTRLTNMHIHMLLDMAPTLRMNPVKYLGIPDENQYFKKSKHFLKLFSKIITSEGVCYTSNVPKEILRPENIQTDYQYYNINHEINGWDYERGYLHNLSFPKRIWGIGETHSLMVTLLSRIDEMYNDCQMPNLGFKIQIHSPAVYPNLFANFIPLQHNASYKIKVKPKIMTTSPHLRSYTPEERQCYFNNERQLQFFRFYNAANCKLECFTNYTILRYGCVHFSMPRISTTPICGPAIDLHKAYAESSDIKPSLISFTKTLTSPIGLEDELSALPNITCDCFSECNIIDYEFSIDPNYNDEKITEDEEKDDGSEEEEQEQEGWQTTSFSVYFMQNYVRGMMRNPLYTFADLVSNFGCLIGLFIGATILSLCEMVNLCIIIRKFCRTPVSESI